MTDRELLEAAAKAAGMPGEWGENIPNVADCSDMFFVDNYPWDPLTDDGDAFRLAVKLRLMPLFAKDTVLIFYDGTLISSHAEPYGDDPAASTRRAITWAAAIHGRALQ